MNNAPGRLTTLEVWVEGMALVKQVYRLPKTFPKEEMYGLTSQLRRATVSILANVAEGVGRGTPGEAARFSRIALGSAYEVFTLLVTAQDLELCEAGEVDPALQQLHQLTKRLSSYIRYQEARK
jgi:four helix bundle protein